MEMMLPWFAMNQNSDRELYSKMLADKFCDINDLSI